MKLIMKVISETINSFINIALLLFLFLFIYTLNGNAGLLIIKLYLNSYMGINFLISLIIK